MPGLNVIPFGLKTRAATEQWLLKERGMMALMELIDWDELLPAEDLLKSASWCEPGTPDHDEVLDELAVALLDRVPANLLLAEGLRRTVKHEVQLQLSRQ